MRKSFLPKHCHTGSHVLTLTVLCRMIESGGNMLAMCIESLGHCGVAVTAGIIAATVAVVILASKLAPVTIPIAAGSLV